MHMQIDVRDRSPWLILACSFAGAAVFAFFAVALIVQTLFGHGSPGGNILRVAMAVFFLFMGFFLVAVGTLYRMSFDEDRGNEFR
jgi:hypothetical protein